MLPGGGGGEPLVACHVDISNCVWSLVLPDLFHTCFCILVDNELYLFKALPFGWVYSPQEVPTQMVRNANAEDVVLLLYYDDILVLGFGAGRIQPAADAIVRVLVVEGAIVSPKSKLMPLDDWIGKIFCFRQGMIQGSHAKWATLLARLLVFSVGYHLRRV